MYGYSYICVSLSDRFEAALPARVALDQRQRAARPARHARDRECREAARRRPRRAHGTPLDARPARDLAHCPRRRHRESETDPRAAVGDWDGRETRVPAAPVPDSETRDRKKRVSNTLSLSLTHGGVTQFGLRGQCTRSNSARSHCAYSLDSHRSSVRSRSAFSFTRAQSAASPTSSKAGSVMDLSPRKA